MEIRVLTSNHLCGNFSFKHSKARDVHAESLGDPPPYDCEKGPERTPKQRSPVGMKQHRRCLIAINQPISTNFSALQELEKSMHDP